MSGMLRWAGLLLVITAAAACTQAPRFGLLEAALVGRARVVDLTHTLEPTIPVFPGGEPFQLTTMASYDQGYSANKFSMGEHTGTHMDAPAHFVQGEPTAEEIPAHTLIAPFVVIDVTKEVANDPDYLLPESALDLWEGFYGRIPPRSVVIMRTGWGARWKSERSALMFRS